MQKQKRTSVISLGRNALSVAVASAMLFAADASATGMGRLTVLSALGQPLKAEIELTSPNKEELGSLTPKLASPEAFKRANIEFNAALDCPVSCTWFDYMGKNYSIEIIKLEPGITKYNINSPVKQGFYYLLVEIEGVKSVRKVCVIE